MTRRDKLKAMSLLHAEHSVLIVIDPQEKLTPAIAGADTAIGNIVRLIRAARRLRIPVLATEQYPQGLGLLIPEILGLVPREDIIEKTFFSAAAEPEFTDALARLDRPRPILCGFEAHVCVGQTALDLRATGYAPAYVRDAAASRDPAQAHAAAERLGLAGIEIVTTEMALFEWLGRAATPDFRDLLPLIR